MKDIIPNTVPACRVTANMLNADIEVHVDPVIAWAADDSPPLCVTEWTPTGFVDLIPIVLDGGQVAVNMKHPPDCHVISELSVDELETAVTYLVGVEWATEVYYAETAGLRWQIDDIVHLLTVPITGDDTPTMSSADRFAFKIGSGGTWSVVNGAADAEVARYADRLDAYAAAFRAEHLLEAVKFVPVSVAELVVPPTTGRVDRAVGEE